MKPTQITIPFANSGLKNDIPDANGQIGQATWQDGFPQITMQPLPPKGDGVPPDGMDMNGVLYEISKAAQYSQMGVLYKFDSSVVAAIGGYPKGAVLLNDAENAAYLSLVDSNTYNFNERPSFIGQYWRPYAGAVIPVNVSQLNNDAGYVKAAGTVGSAVKPTYVGAGVATVCDYELNASVPVGAKFTDTVTTVTVTGSGNAITGITAENGAITATKGGSFLPLTGGTMTGSIIRDGQLAATSGDDGVINILGSTTTQNGAGLWLYGGDASAAGNFLLRAAQSGASTDLVGRNGGALTWGGKIAELIETRGGTYIRYVGGLQICWGTVAYAPIKASGVSGRVTFPVAFSAVPAVTFDDGKYESLERTATNFGYGRACNAVPVDTTGTALSWIAIGYWS